MDFMIQKLNANAQPYYTLVGEQSKGSEPYPPRIYTGDAGRTTAGSFF